MERGMRYDAYRSRKRLPSRLFDETNADESMPAYKAEIGEIENGQGVRHQ